ncbi:MAG: peptidoglycan-binding domain-containing protein [Pseudomonadota bacterium]
MKLLQTLTATAVGASLLFFVPTGETKAGGAGAFFGGVAVGAAGAIIGHKVYKHHKRKKARRYYSSRKSHSSRRVISDQELAANADIQNRLNVLGHNAGAPDGIIGKNTRRAIRSFQGGNGLAVTGRLTNPDIALLYQQSDVVLANNASAGQLAAGGAAAGAAATGAAVTAAAPIDPPSNEGVASSLSAANEVSGLNSEFDEVPAVLGLTVGGGFAGAIDMLKNDGYAECQSSSTALSCTKTSSLGTDVITVASSGDKIHTITRALNFTNPIARDSVVSRLPASYAPIIESDSGAIASSPACDALLIAQPDSFDQITKQSEAGGQFDASAKAFAHACKYYFTLALPQAEQVSTMGLIFFDSSPIVASIDTNGVAAPATTAAQPQAEPELKF